MKVIRRKDIKAKVGFSYHWVVQLEKRGAFPRRIRLGPQSVAWLEHEVDDWLANRARVADGTLPKPIKIGGLTRWVRPEIDAVVDPGAHCHFFQSRRGRAADG